MKNETLIVVTPEGIERWETTKKSLNVTDDIINQLSQHVVRRADNVLPMSLLEPDSKDPIGVAVGENLTCFNLPVRQLQLHCPFTMDSEGVLTPEFESKTSPVMKIPWEVPHDMLLSLLVLIHINDEVISDQYLVANNLSNKSYRLPLANLYEDCKLCSGGFNACGGTCLDLAKRAWEQFNHSTYNADLFGRGTNDFENSRKLFRFKPKAKDDGFEQLPLDVPWTALCGDVVSTTTIQNYLVL